MLSFFLAFVVLLHTTLASAIFVGGPYGDYFYVADMPGPKLKPRIKCEDVLKVEFSHSPLHQNLKRARNRLGDDLELRSFKFAESVEGQVKVSLTFFGGEIIEARFGYNSKKHQLRLEQGPEALRSIVDGAVRSVDLDSPALTKDEATRFEQVQALATALVIPVLFPNEMDVVVQLPGPKLSDAKFTLNQGAMRAMSLLKYSVLVDSTRKKGTKDSDGLMALKQEGL